MAVETERKFIIEKPSLSILALQEGYFSAEIKQSYLETDKNETRRVREYIRDNTPKYFETTKRRISPISAVEAEREIGKAEYEALLKELKKGSRTITKTRHSFPYRERIIEIDVYPEWKKHAIMEIELADEREEINVPDFIKIHQEVSGKREYSNASLAMNFLDEPN